MQKNVDLKVKNGFDGQRVTTDQNIYTCENYLSDGTVKVGTFAFKGSASGNGEPLGVVSATGSALVGFVERVVDASIAPTVEATDVYPVAGPSLISVVTETVPLSFEISVAAYPVLVAYLLEKYPVFDLYDVLYQYVPLLSFFTPETVKVLPFASVPSLS